MRTIVFSTLVVLLPSFPVFADERPLSEQLEKLAPHAAGLAQVEVREIKEVDMRPADGALYLDVYCRILQSTGAPLERIHIIKEHGGLLPSGLPAARFKPHGPVKVDTFKKGERYWVAYSSQYDWARYPQGAINVWPDKDHPKVFDEAIRTDHYAHRPQYEPKSGFTYSYRSNNDKKSWRVRMEKDGKQLWEVTVPGEKFKGEKFEGEWRLLHHDQWPSYLVHTDASRSGWYLFAETTYVLAKDNGFGLPAENHRVTYAFDTDTGKTAAIWVAIMRLGPTSTPSVIQYFDTKSGKVRREERFDSLENGGVAAGAKEERWYRQIVRTYDVDTGKLKKEEILRHTTSPDGSKFVPVNKK